MVMTCEQITEILNNGDYRQKINLYLTELASLNSGGKEFLTQEQRLYIVNNLKGKEINYYNKLLDYNRTFILYKNMILGYVNSINYLSLQIQFILYTENYDKLLSNYIEPELYKNIKLPPHWLNSVTINEVMTDLIKEIEDVKEVIEKSKIALKKNLPVKPYLDFLKEIEKDIKKELTNLDELLNNENILDFNKKQNKESAKNKLPDYDSIKTNISEKDIENYIIR